MEQKQRSKRLSLKDKYEVFEGMDYEGYIASNLWKEKAKQLISLVKQCELCGDKGFLSVHHKHYGNLGNEKRDDLIVVCGKCHRKLHKMEGIDK